MEPESAEEDTMHIMHDIPLEESQMGAHIESMMEDRKSTRLNSSHLTASRMPSSA